MQAQVILLFLVFSLGACAKANSESSSPTATAASVRPSNSIIDLTIAAPIEPKTDAEVFDESVIFSPNFAVNQNDPALSDLFTSAGVSNLCFPTSLAEVLIYLYGYHSPAYSNLRLAGLSQNRNGIDPNALVRQLAGACRTDRTNGTDSLDAIRCAVQVLSESGYGIGNTQLISPFNVDATLPIVHRDVTIQDIRNSLKAGIPLLLEAGWFVFEPNSRTWQRNNGHYVSVFGYDYDASWGENQIQLKVINPETNYVSTRKGALWDTVTLIRVSPQPGVTYPADRPFILTGSGFGGITERAFVGMILTVAPQ